MRAHQGRSARARLSACRWRAHAVHTAHAQGAARAHTQPPPTHTHTRAHAQHARAAQHAPLCRWSSCAGTSWMPSSFRLNEKKRRPCLLGSAGGAQRAQHAHSARVLQEISKQCARARAVCSRCVRACVRAPCTHQTGLRGGGGTRPHTRPHARLHSTHCASQRASPREMRGGLLRELPSHTSKPWSHAWKAWGRGVGLIVDGGGGWGGWGVKVVGCAQGGGGGVVQFVWSSQHELLVVRTGGGARRTKRRPLARARTHVDTQAARAPARKVRTRRAVRAAPGCPSRRC
jgi:hypothetical protein